MKRKLILKILLISWIMPTLSKAQCLVTTIPNGETTFFGGERLIINSDTVNERIGFMLILNVTIAVDKKTLGYNPMLMLQLLKLSSKPLHYPNYVKFKFVNGRTLEFYSNENDIQTKDEGGIKYSQVLFNLKEGELAAFQKIPLTMITVADATTHQIMIDKSRSQDIMVETNCVMKKVGLE